MSETDQKIDGWLTPSDSRPVRLSKASGPIEPYDGGFTSRLRGTAFEMNPYPLNSAQWCQWADGWQDQDHHLSDRDEALASIGWFG